MRGPTWNRLQDASPFPVGHRGWCHSGAKYSLECLPIGEQPREKKAEYYVLM